MIFWLHEGTMIRIGNTSLIRLKFMKKHAVDQENGPPLLLNMQLPRKTEKKEHYCIEEHYYFMYLELN